ncbi:short-chain dehydrogenase [Kineobactrum sediminis]|uniref:Short-chain dehydrogenase n=1 Tax=Kineobactrum sediminis TaxID=1905677 RepID=A0A2N5Y069_9GAMM|nr:SDR family oxidoreductase [Kineobactrum sediminis]PLW81792.1 short-chain dehydrogenase [Kineobactrum sediminis]
MGRLNGKVALITGAGSGVGAACMDLFLAKGAKVVGVGRTESHLQDTLDGLEDIHASSARIVAADVSTETGVECAVQHAKDAFGSIDILVHAAGVGYSWEKQSPGSMADVVHVTPDKWSEVMRINLDAYYLLCRAIVPVMKAGGGGSIVGVTSISGFQGLSAAHAYTAAKAGMINLTRSMSVSYVRDNIRVNCIAPGFIATPMVEDVLNLFDDAQTAEQLSPMCRPGTPEEMAYGCLYLASDESTYCSGTVLVIDGGTTARQ